MDKIFKNYNLNKNYLELLLKEFWFAPCDAYLRAPEIAIWNSINPKKKVLNIGCADGRMDTYLFKHMEIDVAIDNEKNAIEEAIKNKLYKKVLLAGAENMPFEDGTFSSIISNSTLEHIEKDKEAIAEASRVLKKGGNMIFTVPSVRFIKFMESIGFVGKEFEKYNKRVAHLHYRTVPEWKKILEENGLFLKYYRYYYPPAMMKIWWFLFRLTTMKVYRRELWSYLKDSPYGKIFPAKLISKIEYFLLKNSYKKAFDANGCWVFIWATKK